jgi:predicted oxidoreductase
VIEEVAGAIKDLIKAGTVRQFGMSEAAAGTIRLQSPAAHARKGRRPLAAEGAPRAI